MAVVGGGNALGAPEGPVRLTYLSQTYDRLLALILALYSHTVLMLLYKITVAAMTTQAPANCTTLVRPLGSLHPTQAVPMKLLAQGRHWFRCTFSQTYGRLLTLILAPYSPTVLMLVRQRIWRHRRTILSGRRRAGARSRDRERQRETERDRERQRERCRGLCHTTAGGPR